ncbi:hypothetical protein Mapa_002730 [Marchantia paleacea]|nr:hypothetical protein Mapa_002730 [Marchantia paleacea]
MPRRDDSYPRLVNREEEEEEEGEWVADFCGCLADPPTCLLTMFCPCIAAGMVIEKLDSGRTHCLTAALVWLVLQELTTCGCLYTCTYRRKLRNMYNLPSRPCPDSLTHYFLWPCAICQELRELKARETSYYGFGEDFRTSVIPPRRQIMDSR